MKNYKHHCQGSGERLGKGLDLGNRRVAKARRAQFAPLTPRYSRSNLKENEYLPGNACKIGFQISTNWSVPQPRERENAGRRGTQKGVEKKGSAPQLHTPRPEGRIE
jgi:hypothetical protein